ncbi:MAG: hypothetical protein ACOYNI_05485 [Acidimicrobiia bacterium]
MASNVASNVDPYARIRHTFDQRASTDYIFDYWTALGWSLLTFGVFYIFIVYKLAERSKRHVQRRVAQLHAANELGWAAAVRAGRDQELYPQFQRTAAGIAGMQSGANRQLDPVIWAIIVAFAGSIGQIVLFWQLDAALVEHERHERDVEVALAEIYSALGAPLWAPYGPTKQPHNYVGRTVATVGSFGAYAFWWLYNVEYEGNAHFATDWQWEAALVEASGRLR